MERARVSEGGERERETEEGRERNRGTEGERGRGKEEVRQREREGGGRYIDQTSAFFSSEGRVTSILEMG